MEVTRVTHCCDISLIDRDRIGTYLGTRYRPTNIHSHSTRILQLGRTPGICQGSRVLCPNEGKIPGADLPARGEQSAASPDGEMSDGEPSLEHSHNYQESRAISQFVIIK